VQVDLLVIDARGTARRTQATVELRPQANAVVKAS
jgi:hypothetical protein